LADTGIAFENFEFVSGENRMADPGVCPGIVPKIVKTQPTLRPFASLATQWRPFVEMPFPMPKEPWKVQTSTDAGERVKWPAIVIEAYFNFGIGDEASALRVTELDDAAKPDATRRTEKLQGKKREYLE